MQSFVVGVIGVSRFGARIGAGLERSMRVTLERWSAEAARTAQTPLLIAEMADEESASAAAIAAEMGWQVHALQSESRDYESHLPGAQQERFRALMKRCARQATLPGSADVVITELLDRVNVLLVVDPAAERMEFVRHANVRGVRVEVLAAAPAGAQEIRLDRRKPDQADASDMVDKAELEWLNRRIAAGETGLRPLQEVLGLFESSGLNEEFTKYDRQASRRQTCYRAVSFTCVLCVAGAVGLALLQLVKWPQSPGSQDAVHAPEHIRGAELGLVGLAGLLVGLDLCWFAFRDKWLTARTQAEHLRSLKFQTLLEPATWSQELSATDAQLRARISRIQQIKREHLEEHMRDSGASPPGTLRLTDSPDLHRAIVNYYDRRRLEYQSDYAAKRPYYRHDQHTKWVGTFLFLLVPGLVLWHYFTHDPFWSAASTGLAAFVPALGAAFHVYRSGREWGRNHLRTEALSHLLSELDTHLEHSRSMEEQVHILRESEAILVREHQQWLQLMKEAEWYA